MTRFVQLLRAAYAAALLAAPTRVLGAIGGDPADAAAVTTARVLGGRHLLQAVATGGHPGPVRRYGGAVVDLLHAASMFAYARSATEAPASRRRPALFDGSIAAAFVVAGLAAGRNHDE